jgi:FdhD protein
MNGDTHPEITAKQAETALSLVKNELGQPPRAAADLVAAEEPLEIRVRGKSIAVTMRTPGHDAELAAGFLLSEGILRQRSDVLEIAPCETGESFQTGNILNVFLAPSVEVDFEKLTRHVFASSSCGLCGKASIDSVLRQLPPIDDPAEIRASLLCQFPESLRKKQAAFARTGGLHAAALFDLEGNLLVIREDVGRHNAVDKVIGWGFLNGHLPFSKRALLVSGRTSFEIMQKGLSARIPIVAAVSAPSSLAVEFARESNQTLVGFLRGATFNTYSAPERITPL